MDRDVPSVEPKLREQKVLSWIRSMRTLRLGTGTDLLAARLALES